MKHGGIRWILALVLLASLLAACGGGETPAPDTSATAESAGSEESEPVEKLVIDSPGLDPDAYYTFDNPGGWTVYQKINLSDPEETVTVGIWISVDETLSFEDYVKAWSDTGFETRKTEDGRMYTIMDIGGTLSVFTESPDGVHWSFQIHKRTEEADPKAFVDTVVQIALSATYIPRESEPESEG